MQNPLVTIAIPTYNRADGFLPKALEAACAQTYEPVEILVSDNCSTDGTHELLAEYQDDSRFRYIRHANNLGAHGNFNFCVDAARGEFFLMLHDDDLIDPELLKTCIEAVEGKSGVGYVRTGNRVIDEQGKTVREYPNRVAGEQGAAAVLGWMERKNFWALSSTLYELSALRNLGGFSEDEFPLTCDCYATAQIALSGKGVELEPVMASFRVHDGELTNQVSARRWVDEWFGLYHRLLELVPSESDRALFEKVGPPFFSQLAYNHTEKIEGPIARYVTMLYVYSKFRGRHLPPPLRDRIPFVAA